MQAVAAASSGGGGSAALGFVLIGLGAAAYWAPAITAWIRRVPNAGSVTVVNLFLGWTVIGWVAALAMACRSHPRIPYAAPPWPPLPPPGPPPGPGG